MFEAHGEKPGGSGGGVTTAPAPPSAPTTPTSRTPTVGRTVRPGDDPRTKQFVDG